MQKSVFESKEWQRNFHRQLMNIVIDGTVRFIIFQLLKAFNTRLHEKFSLMKSHVCLWMLCSYYKQVKLASIRDWATLKVYLYSCAIQVDLVLILISFYLKLRKNVFNIAKTVTHGFQLQTLSENFGEKCVSQWLNSNPQISVAGIQWRLRIKLCFTIV